ncbi:MAG: alkaline phosphatase family protein [Gammaproteobacteria bacterium]|nr:alkaline phosphatase family protein [Gammaproteobacteria bacterium]
MIRPDYHGGSIVNLMSTIMQGLGDASNYHAPLKELSSGMPAAAQNVVLLVIDGLGYHYLTEVGKHSALTRHLRAKLTTVFPSTTATAITTFLTGLAPQQHGLTGWFTYFHELGSIIAVLPFRPRFGGAPSGELNISVKSLYGHTPIFDLIKRDCYIIAPDSIAYSDFNLAHSGKAHIKPYKTLAECFKFTRDIIHGNQQKKYIYTYWPLLDGMAHDKGIGSHDVKQHFRDIDRAFSRFINNIKGSDTLVIATADHGIIDSGREHCIELEHYPQLQDMLTMPLTGERRMAYCYVETGRHEAFKNYLQNTFDDQMKIFDSRQLIEQHYFGLGEPHPQLHHRVGDYTLAMNGNLTIMDAVPGEKRYYHIGTHGGMSEQEMYVPLIIVEA